MLGVTAPQIIKAVKTLRQDFPITRVTVFNETVALAAKIAEPGDVVLLSPACASYDMFKNYQERGALFQKNW